MGANLLSQRQIRKVLEELNAGGEIKLDANETAFVERELTQVRAKVMEVVYAELKAMNLVPLATDISPNARQYVYYVLDMVGEAKVIASGSDDLPRVDISKVERSGVVKPVGASYGWDIFELQSAAQAGSGSITAQKGAACRRAIASAIDKLLSIGQTNSQTGLGMTGLLNNADVEALGIVAGTLWVLGTTTAATMIDFLNGVVRTIVTATNELWVPDTIVLPTATYGVFADTRYGVDANMTALKWFEANNPNGVKVTSWYRGNGAGASSKNRGVVYKRDPVVLEGVAPVLYAEQPPQARNLELVVPAYGKGGGTKVYHPEACRYIDFALS